MSDVIARSPRQDSAPSSSKYVAVEAFAPVEVRSAVDIVTKQILGLISSGVLNTGDRLPSEADLARRLRVGRSTVREVKQILGSWGFLRFEGTRGCFISEPQSGPGDDGTNVLLSAMRHGSIEDLHEARLIIDTGIIRLATTRATVRQVGEIGAFLDELATRVDDPTVFFSSAAEFHALLAALCGNPILEELYHLISEITLVEQRPEYQEESDPLEVLEIHRRLLNAVATGDPNVAAREMVEHLDESHHKTGRTQQPQYDSYHPGVKRP